MPLCRCFLVGADGLAIGNVIRMDHMKTRFSPLRSVLLFDDLQHNPDSGVAGFTSTFGTVVWAHKSD